MKVSPPALVALILASGVAFAMVALAIAVGVSEARRDSLLSEAAANLLATALGAAIGALSTYLGVTRNGDRDDRTGE